MDCKPGPPTVLTTYEEEKLASYVVKMADMGFGFTREDLQITAFRLLTYLDGVTPSVMVWLVVHGWMDSWPGSTSYTFSSYRTTTFL